MRGSDHTYSDPHFVYAHHALDACAMYFFMTSEFDVHVPSIPMLAANIDPCCFMMITDCIILENIIPTTQGLIWLIDVLGNGKINMSSM